jgi:hypothetical protein
MQSQRRLLMHSLSRLNQLEEFDKRIPVRDVLCEQLNLMLTRIDKYMPKTLEMFEQPPSKKKLREIYYYNKPLDDKLEKNYHLIFW